MGCRRRSSRNAPRRRRRPGSGQPAAGHGRSTQHQRAQRLLARLRAHGASGRGRDRGGRAAAAHAGRAAGDAGARRCPAACRRPSWAWAASASPRWAPRTGSQPPPPAAAARRCCSRAASARPGSLSPFPGMSVNRRALAPALRAIGQVCAHASACFFSAYLHHTRMHCCPCMHALQGGMADN